MKKFPKGMIIAFEGLDCSFKETNFKEFNRRLRAEFPDATILNEAFPRYDNPASDNCQKWLKGIYDRNHLKTKPVAVNSLYAVDRLSYWYELVHLTITKEDGFMIDILRNSRIENADPLCFIFDRYTFSTPIYNPKYGFTSVNDFKFEIDNFGIPKPNIVVWMRMNNFSVLEGLLCKKQGRDKNETDIEFLKKTWENLERVIAHKHIYEEELGTRIIPIECLNEDGSIRTEREIADDVWNKVSEIVDAT